MKSVLQHEKVAERLMKTCFHVFQELEFKEFARKPDAYQTLCNMIAPSIFGHEDVKKSVVCLLFGGSRKVTLFSRHPFLYCLGACPHTELYLHL
jgi:DNA replicative helicase MCM subunit Mcm2 (Cdc46/Mcm family)